MGRKSNHTAEQKQKVVQAYKEGRLSQAEAARRCSVSRDTIRKWIARERCEGPEALEVSATNRIYSPELKEQAVKAYLSGKGSQRAICEQFQIKDSKQLRNWIKVYNSGKNFVNKMSGGSRMKNTRQVDFEERVQIAKECYESGNNYGEIAKKYNISYQQARDWTLKFIELGEKGLEDRRGKRKHTQEPRTKLEEAEIEIAKLKHQLYLSEVENHLLKKMKELERRNVLDK